MPEGTQGGGTEMDPVAVEAIGREFDQLAKALAAAAAYAGHSELTAEDFGGLPNAKRIGGQFMTAVTQLATSLGYVSQLAASTEQALLASAGLQTQNETTETARFDEAGTAVI
jgi:hypothetical protein